MLYETETNYAQDSAEYVMSKTEQEQTNTVTLKTRFGVMEIDRDKSITLPQGMVGFSEFKEFGLSIPAHPVLEGFMLLQSIEEADLTFILRPYDLNSEEIASEDLAGAVKQYNIAPENLAVMLVTTLRQSPNGIKKSVNMRAPLLIDTQRRQGWQHILHSDAYNVRHPLAD